MKKFLFVIAIVITALILCVHVILLTSHHIITFVVEKKLPGKIAFSSYSYKHHHLILSDVSIDKIGEYHCHIEKLKIGFPYFFSSSHIFDISLKKPKILLQKPMEMFPQKEKGSFFPYVIRIDDGEVSLQDQEEKMFFSLLKKPQSIKAHFQFLEGSLHIVQENNRLFTKWKDCDLQQAFTWLSLFYKTSVHSMRGKSSGFFSAASDLVLMEMKAENFSVATSIGDFGADYFIFDYDGPFSFKKQDIAQHLVDASMENGSFVSVDKKITIDSVQAQIFLQNGSSNIDLEARSHFSDMTSNLSCSVRAENKWWKHFTGNISSKGEINSSISIEGGDFHQEEGFVQCHMQDLTPFFTALAVQFFPQYEIELLAHIAQGDAKFIWTNDHTWKYRLWNLSIRDILLHKNHAHIEIGSILGSVEKIDAGHSCDIELHGISGHSKDRLLSIKKAESVLQMEQGYIKKAEITGDICDLQTTASFQGKKEEWKGEIVIEGSSEALPVKKPFSLAMNLLGEGQKINLSAIAKADKEEKNVDIALSMDINEHFLFSHQIAKAVQKGWVRAKNLPLEWLNFYQKKFPMQATGDAHLAGFFDGQTIRLYLQGEELVYKTPFLEVCFKEIGNHDPLVEKGNSLHIEYNLLTQTINSFLPTVDGTFYLPLNDCRFSFFGARGKGKGHDLLFDLPVVVIEGLELSGKCSWLGKEQQLDIDCQSYKGSVSAFNDVLAHFTQNIEVSDLKGTTQGKFSYFHDFSQKKNAGNIDAYLHNVSGIFAKKYVFSDLCTHIMADSLQEKYIIEELEGQIGQRNTPLLTWTAPLISKNHDNYELDVRIEKGTLELFRVCGKGKQKDDIISWKFDDELCHFLSVPLHIMAFSHDTMGNLTELNMEPTFQGPHLSLLMRLIQDAYLKNENNIFDLQGNFYTKIYKDPNEAYFWIEGKNLAIEKKEFAQFLFKGHFDKELFIDHCKLDDWEGEGKGHFVDTGFMLDNFRISKNEECSLDIQGKWEKKTNTLLGDIQQLKGTIAPFFPKMSGDLVGTGSFCFCYAPFKFHMQTYLEPTSIHYADASIDIIDPLELQFSTEEGTQLSNIHAKATYKNMTCLSKIQELNIDREYHLQGVHLSFAPDTIESILQEPQLRWVQDFCNFFNIDLIFNQDMDIFFDIASSKDFSHVSITSKEGHFTINEKERHLKDIELQKKDNIFLVNGHYLHNRHYFSFNNFFDAHSLMGTTKMGKENTSDMLQLRWKVAPQKGIVLVEGIEGTVSGVNLHFYPKNQTPKELHLFGRVIIDFSEAKDLLGAPYETFIEKMQFGKGYEFLGDVIFTPQNLALEGSISGKNFSLFGYEMKTLLAKIVGKGDLWEVTDIEISDPAGHFFVKNFSYDQGKISCPQMEGKDLRPSILHQIGTEHRPLEPLVIRNIEITDIQGDLAHLESIQGEGKMTFINSFKRGHAVLDIPSDVLSRIVGLDQELLIPVEGELAFTIKDRACHFTSLKKAYSENHRSKFILLDPSYIDFSGNMDIQIKMKQYVLFKITEKFQLSITGNILKPNVNLRKKRTMLP